MSVFLNMTETLRCSRCIHCVPLKQLLQSYTSTLAHCNKLSLTTPTTTKPVTMTTRSGDAQFRLSKLEPVVQCGQKGDVCST